MPNPVRASDTNKIAKSTGLPVDQVNPFVVMFGDKAYVNTDGRRWKMDERFGAGGWSAEVEVLGREAYSNLLMQWGKEPPMIIVRCTICIDGKPMYQDYGWSSPDSTPAGAKQFQENGLGLATTKALNRAMGQGIADGFASGEKYDRMSIQTGSFEANFLREAGRLKKEVGEEFYYDTLKDYGVDHANAPSLQGAFERMTRILDVLRDRSRNEASEIVFGSAPSQGGGEVISPDVVAIGSGVSAAGNLALFSLDKLGDESLSIEERGNIIGTLADDLSEVDKLKESGPDDNSGTTYAQIMSEYVSNAMAEDPPNLKKAEDVLRRTIMLLNS